MGRRQLLSVRTANHFSFNFSTLSVTIDGPKTLSVSGTTFCYHQQFYHAEYLDYSVLQLTVSHDGPLEDRRTVSPSVAPHFIIFPLINFSFFDVFSKIITYGTSQGRQTVKGPVDHNFCKFQHRLQCFFSG